MSLPGEFSLTVEPGDSGLRLDAFVAVRFAVCSRSQAAGLIRNGYIRVDGETRKPGYRVRPREQVTGELPPPLPTALIPEPMTLDILFEDQSLIVLNKPPGLVVHPAAGHRTGTLVHGLLHHCPDMEGFGGEQRPGIVHRLDKDTSGVLVVAKNDRTHQALAQQFKRRSITKMYLALVNGTPKAEVGRIELPVGRHPVERKKMSTSSPRGRPALTLWRVRERFRGATLLELDLKTGRTHQIRVHCQAMGYPIVGDQQYGQRRARMHLARHDPQLYPVADLVRRQMLHAARLGFSHPITGQLMIFEAALPQDMADVIMALRNLIAEA